MLIVETCSFESFKNHDNPSRSTDYSPCWKTLNPRIATREHSVLLPPESEYFALVFLNFHREMLATVMIPDIQSGELADDSPAEPFGRSRGGN